MTEKRAKGQILNHSSKELFVLETDSGPPIVHHLGPKRKSPAAVDADGIKRADGERILLHGSWWKVPNHFSADIYQVGDNILIPVSVMAPVSDKHFGEYEIHHETDWGEVLTYVTSILKDKRGKTIGYIVEGRGEVNLAEAINLASEGKIDNVVLVKNRNGSVYLRTKKTTTTDDYLTA